MALFELNNIHIETQGLLKSFKGPEELEIRRLPKFYLEYSAEWTVKNLAWLVDMIINIHNNTMRDKGRE